MLKGNVLRKRVHSSKHLFKAIGDRGSWGIDLDVLNDLPERGSIFIEDIDTKILYMSRVAQWKEHGTILHFKELSADHAVQCFLPIDYFDKTRA